MAQPQQCPDNLRVLHVIPSLVGGGAERQVVLLAAAQVAAGLEVHLAYLHDGPNLEAARQCGAVLHPVATGNNHDPRLLMRFMRLIGNIKPDLVQTWLLNADVFAGMAARACGVPWLLCERNSAQMYTGGAKFRLRRWLGKHADAVAANSDAGLTYWRDVGFTGPGRVIRNIMPVLGSGPSGLATGAIPPDDVDIPRVVAVGRLSPEKNYLALLDALEQLLPAHPGTQAWILGEGPMRPLLESRVRASPVLAGQVHLPGFVTDVDRHLQGAAVYVSLSKFEGSPNSVAEAVAQGCPLVLSDIGAHREWLTGQEALWVDPDDTGAVVTALATQLHAPESARQAVTGAAQRLRAWSGDRIAAEYIDFYRSFTKGRVACASS
jgi:glycosyltransferase involved in cell wall biosynthesis